MAILAFNRDRGAAEDILDKQQEPAEERLKVAEALAEPAEKRLKSRFKPLRAARNAGIAPFDSIFANLIPVAAAVAAASCTISGGRPRDQTILYLITLASMILIDPLKAITFFLAPQTRVFLAADLVLIIPVILKPSFRCAAVVAVFVLVTLLLCWGMNRNWLYCYNWLASKSAQRAVTKSPEAKGCISWQKSGKRECRAALAECGLKFNEDLLNGYGMTIFLVGFYSGYQNTEKVKKRANKALEALDDLTEYTGELEADIEGLSETLELQEQAIDELEPKVEAYHQLNAERLQLEARVNGLRNDIERLKQANAELLAAAPDNLQKAAAEAEADIEERQQSEIDYLIREDLLLAEEMRGRGLKAKGTRKIAADHGVTRAHVEKIQKELKERRVVNFSDQAEKEPERLPAVNDR
ncbi:MAG: hypothetical protein Q4B85_12565 [Lachnospiraceae bacterium]|nr:hypothetical protein [Lachnospiraceae bacterium]